VDLVEIDIVGLETREAHVHLCQDGATGQPFSET
jgi:hypothetical protein